MHFQQTWNACYGVCSLGFFSPQGSTGVLNRIARNFALVIEPVVYCPSGCGKGQIETEPPLQNDDQGLQPSRSQH